MKKSTFLKLAILYIMFLLLIVITGCGDDISYSHKYWNKFFEDVTPEPEADSVSIFPVFRMKGQYFYEYYFSLDTSNPPFIDSDFEIYYNYDDHYTYIEKKFLPNDTRFYWEFYTVHTEFCEVLRYYTDIRAFTTCSRDGTVPELWIQNPPAETDTIYGSINFDIGVSDKSGIGFLQVFVNDTTLVKDFNMYQGSSFTWDIFAEPPGEREVHVKCWDNSGEYSELTRQINFGRCVRFYKGFYSNVDFVFDNGDTLSIPDMRSLAYYPANMDQNEYAFSWSTSGLESIDGLLGEKITVWDDVTLGENNVSRALTIPEDYSVVNIRNQLGISNFIIRGITYSGQETTFEKRFNFDYNENYTSIAFYIKNDYSDLEISAYTDYSSEPVKTISMPCRNHYNNTIYFDFSE